MDYDNLLKLVKSRRSIRRFKSDPIPIEYVDKIIEVARWAPSGFNQQPWEFVVVRKPELKNKIVEFCRESRIFSPRMESTREPWQGAAKITPHQGEPDFSLAPVFILVLGDNRTREGLPMTLRYDPYRQQVIFISGLADRDVVYAFSRHVSKSGFSMGFIYWFRLSTMHDQKPSWNQK